jgi:hypothetical protein
MADIASPIKTLGNFPAVDPTVAAIGTADQIADGETNVSMRSTERKSIADTLANILRLATLYRFASAADVQPVVGTRSGGLIFGYRKSNGEALMNLPAFGSSLLPFTLDRLARPLIRHCTFKAASSPSDIIPLFGTLKGGVILGVRKSNGKVVGNFEVAAAASAQATIPVATPPLLNKTAWNGSIVYGQSLSIGERSTPLLSSTSIYSYVLSFGSGPKSGKAGSTSGAVNTSPGTSTVTALVEVTTSAEGSAATGETPCSGAANSFVSRAIAAGSISAANLAGGFTYVTSAAGHGGYRLDQLYKAAAWYQNFIDHVTDFKAAAVAAGKTLTIQTVDWLQGESDAAAGTTRSTYASRLSTLRTDMDTDTKAITGQTAPVHMLTYQTASRSSSGGSLAALNLIQLGQMDAIEQDDFIHFVTPVYHLPHYADAIHLSNIGSKWAGRYFGRARHQLVNEAREPDCIWPIAAWSKGTTAFVKFRVPTLPLRLDSGTLIGLATNFGFRIKDDTGNLTLSNIVVTADGDTVQFTLNRALGANPVVRYALDYLGSGVALLDGASGNLCDSNADTFVEGSTTYSLRHWAPHFEKPILIVENA